MGLEAVWRVEFNGRVCEGKTLLEEKDLVCAEISRLKIPFPEMKSFEADKGILRIVFSGGEARFHLGSKADKGYLKIHYPRSRLDKLGVKPAKCFEG